MQLGHIKCYFSPDNKYSNTDREVINRMALDCLSTGWKVALEYESKTKTYTLYWGA